MLNTHAENQFQLLIGSDWEDWIVIRTYHRGLNIKRYLVGRLKDESEHYLTIEKVNELFNTKKLRI